MSDHVQPFAPVDDWQPAVLADRDCASKLEQWGLAPGAELRRLRSAARFRPGDEQEAGAFFEALAAQLGLGGVARVEPLTASVLRMDFFDRLQEAGVVAPSGSLRRCMDDVVDGVSVSDELRALLVREEESDHMGLFSADEQQELIFALFKWLVVGGSVCQPEETWDAYLRVTKALYRSLVTVHRAAADGQVKIPSLAYRLHLAADDSPHSVCFAVVEPAKRWVTVLRSAFVPFW